MIRQTSCEECDSPVGAEDVADVEDIRQAFGEFGLQLEEAIQDRCMTVDMLRTAREGLEMLAARVTSELSRRDAGAP